MLITPVAMRSEWYAYVSSASTEIDVALLRDQTSSRHRRDRLLGLNDSEKAWPRSKHAMEPWFVPTLRRYREVETKPGFFDDLEWQLADVQSALARRRNLEEKSLTLWQKARESKAHLAQVARREASSSVQASRHSA